MARAQLEPAWVLSARPYRETSALVELFAQRAGRIGLVARGVRSGRARTRGLLQPFQPLLVSFSDRGELGTLAGLEPAGPPVVLRGEAVFSGWYLNELVLRLVARRDPHPQLFEDYGTALGALGGGEGRRHREDSNDAGTSAGRVAGAAAGVIEKTQSSPALAHGASLRVFEKGLLTELGYGLQLPDPVEPDAWYRWDADHGLRLAEPGPSSYRGASLRALADEVLDTPECLRDARRLLRVVLSPHLGERKLRTPEMLRALRAVQRASGARSA
jgi:DNA repair protein RecO (recombination protein O)